MIDTFNDIDSKSIDDSINPNKIKIPIKTKEEKEIETRLHKQENARVNKWKEMLQVYPFQVHKKLRSRGRKGIPDSFRGYCWCLLSDALSISAEEESAQVKRYRNKKFNGTSKQDKSEVTKLMQNLMQQEGNEKTLVDIHKDAPRTLPNHIYF